MLNESTYLQFDLDAGTPVSLWTTEECEVHCVHGRVWITEENGGEDICLEAGQRARLTHPGQTVVQASSGVEAAQCRLYRLPENGHAGHLSQWLHAWTTGLSIGRLMSSKSHDKHGVGIATVF